MPMLAVEQLSKTYGRLRALRDVSVAFAPGEVVAIIGPNGSGKTTLIKCLLGLVRPTAGTVLFESQPVIGTWAYRQHLGYMPQISRFPDNLSVGQLFAFVQSLRPITDGEADLTLVDALGLRAQLDKPLGTLSGGTRQKVSAVLAFLFRPRVLILDEPSAGLDPVSAELLFDRIRAARAAGVLVLITSHLMSEVEALADRVLYMAEGRASFYETRAALAAHAPGQSLSRAILQRLQASTV